MQFLAIIAAAAAAFTSVNAQTAYTGVPVILTINGMYVLNQFRIGASTTMADYTVYNMQHSSSGLGYVFEDQTAGLSQYFLDFDPNTKGLKEGASVTWALNWVNTNTFTFKDTVSGNVICDPGATATTISVGTTCNPALITIQVKV